MESSIMNKPVGGRGQKAAKPTMMRRIPEGIREAVDQLAELYRDDEWDGTVEGLNLISSNKKKSLIPDIKNQLAELNELREWKRRSESQLTELGDLRENLRELQRANLQADRDLAKAVAMKCQADDEVRRLQQQVSNLDTDRQNLDAENLKLSEQTADLNLKIQNLEEQLKKHESPTYSAVSERNAKIADLEKRNQELRVIVSNERFKKNELAAEVTERDRTIYRLQERYAVLADRADELADVSASLHQSPPREELLKIRDRILSQTRSDKLKATTTAIDKFINVLLTDQTSATS